MINGHQAIEGGHRLRVSHSPRYDSLRPPISVIMPRPTYPTGRYAIIDGALQCVILGTSAGVSSGSPGCSVYICRSFAVQHLLYGDHREWKQP